MNCNSLLAKAEQFIRVAAPEIFGVRPELKRRVKTKGPDSTMAAAPATGPGSEKYQRILDAAVEVIAERGYFSSVVREVVRRGQQEGIFRRDVSDGVVAHCMFGAIDELLSSAVFTGRVYDAKATAAQVMDVLLNGITAGSRE